ncbi:hypothetical protein GUITHDRAFT_115077 [Guillardia theta CCMP2712]|uniref:Uncharacterized protein n=1 Tax=Guillardia theta (strain CCMP2712) TaxID=905079 RepID=L1IR63_GUITC|nr:hypothetical protein GUITHDRAFT_115077 [Guillardia theta CCMP2712]EKX38748.1 hypothetical protein GUITHDRAFT_115077 [Guillardia theta CCMP2712]|eukprot:XP_005825728.1 hypothetical protein GUITHDRAFT_115077 [Guillardia theta CCMP2712]
MSTGHVGSVPPSACDMERMRRCKEEMECACMACDPQKLWTWNEKFVFWVKDERERQTVLEMRRVAAVLSHVGESRYGVALTLLNDETAWINPAQTCKSSRAFEKERECKDRVRKRSFPLWKHCSQMHEFLQCMCNACEDDVEEAVRGLGSYSRCPRLHQVSRHLPHCGSWYQDECVTEHGASFCENVHGSDAWKAAQGAQGVAGAQQGDGMSWKNFCSGVVSSLSASEEVLEETLGGGWKEWCVKYLSNSTTAAEAGGDREREEGEEGEAGGDGEREGE